VMCHFGYHDVILFMCVDRIGVGTNMVMHNNCQVLLFSCKIKSNLIRFNYN
jgi:hypothetical protein